MPLQEQSNGIITHQGGKSGATFSIPVTQVHEIHANRGGEKRKGHGLASMPDFKADGLD